MRKASTLTFDQVKPGTGAAIASIHMGRYGQTKQIPLTENLSERIEKVQKIGALLDINRSEIISLNTALSSRDRNSFVNLFHKHQEYYDKLRWQHQLRDRLLSMFDRAVKKLLYIS